MFLRSSSDQYPDADHRQLPKSAVVDHLVATSHVSGESQRTSRAPPSVVRESEKKKLASASAPRLDKNNMCRVLVPPPSCSLCLLSRFTAARYIL